MLYGDKSILCRANEPLDQRRREKLSVFCNVKPENVLPAPDVDSIYDIPLNFEREHVGEKILAGFGLTRRTHDLRDWRALAAKRRTLRKDVRIAIVGKYFTSGGFVLADAYISVIEALKHAAWHRGVRPILDWINADQLAHDPKALRALGEYQGILVPGGFGIRGTEGKMAAIRLAREAQVPFFGLCFGMQLAVIEFARHVLGWRDASSTELHPRTKHPVIGLMAEQKERLAGKHYGGTMRLGAYRCRLAPGSLAANAYRAGMVRERHRHRYELNNAYRDDLAAAGMAVTGVNPETQLAEIIELSGHPFFLGVQFHPEFLTRPLRPHPLFAAFLHATASR